MTFLEHLRAELALPETADELAVLAAVRAARSTVTLHAQQLTTLSRAAKLDDGADADAIITALQAAGADRQLDSVVALQTRIQELEGRESRSRAETAIDGAMRAGKPIPASERDELISRHMADPEGTDFWIGKMISLHSGGVPPGAPPTRSAAIDDSEAKIIAALGIDEATYLRSKRTGEELRQE